MITREKAFPLMPASHPELVKKALTNINTNYNIEFFNLEKIFGVVKARTIARVAGTSSAKAKITNLIESQLALEFIWKYTKHLLQPISKKPETTVSSENTDSQVSIIMKILINENPVITSRASAFDHTRLFTDTNINLDPVTGKIIILTSNWAKGEKIEYNLTYDSLPKALRATQHQIDSLCLEYQQNKELINMLQHIIDFVPSLGQNSTDDEREQFNNELLVYLEKLKQKRHKLKIESKNFIATTSDNLGAIELMRTSDNPERIKHRKERNWPAALMKIIAARDRFIQRNIEIIEQISPALYKRRQNLLAGYTRFRELHNRIDRIISNYVNLLYRLRKQTAHLKPAEYDEVIQTVNFVNNWLAPYLHDKSFNRLLWNVGKNLGNSLIALNDNKIQKAFDNVLLARVAQIKHYQALIMDNENKGIIVGTESKNVPYQAKT